MPLVVVELGLLLPHARKQLELSWKQLFVQGIRPQLIPLAMILVYSILVYQLPIQETWLHIFGIVTGAVLVLGAGLAITYKKIKVS